MSEPDSPRVRVKHHLRGLMVALADVLDDDEIRRAERTMDHLPPGRPEIDDSRSLAEMEGLIEKEKAPSVSEAARRVAAAATGGKDRGTVQSRLERKWRERKNSATE